ncbi:MAG: threonine/serine dehydratase [Marinicellaceae bacterium]
MLELKDIIKASKNVYQHLQPTPLRHYSALSNTLGAQVWLKHENHNPTCAFKIRGGFNCVASLTKKQKKVGIYTASTGNHGQSIALAAKTHGMKATIFVPNGANEGKVKSMQSMGAEVEYFGKDFDDARAGALKASNKMGGLFVGPTDDVLIAGVGSYTLEIMHDLPEVDYIIVPVGAGSGVCATSIVAKAMNPKVQIIGVQSKQSPTQQLSWKNKSMMSADNTTIAEGMATGVAFHNTQEIMQRYLDDFILVDDTEIIKATKTLIETSHNLIEEASAATYAAALQIKSQLKGKNVVLIISGGNISMKKLSKLFS